MSMENTCIKTKTKMNILIRVAAVLLCLTLLSTCLVSGLFARYSISSQDSDSSRVAKFSIEGSGTLLEQTIEASLIPGEETFVTLQIDNNSEVAVEYTVVVTNKTTNLPLSFRMEKEGDSPNVDTNGTTFTAQRLPGGYTDKHKLHIKWEETENDPTLMGKVDYITVTVTAAQID